MRDRDRRGSAASDWAEAQSGLPDWGVRGAWDLGAHNPTPDLELWSRRGMIKQPFGGVVPDIAPEGDGRGTTLVLVKALSAHRRRIAPKEVFTFLLLVQ